MVRSHRDVFSNRSGRSEPDEETWHTGVEGRKVQQTQAEVIIYRARYGASEQVEVDFAFFTLPTLE